MQEQIGFQIKHRYQKMKSLKKDWKKCLRRKSFLRNKQKRNSTNIKKNNYWKRALVNKMQKAVCYGCGKKLKEKVDRVERSSN